MPHVRKYTTAWFNALEATPSFQKLIIDVEIEEEFQFLDDISDIFSDFDDESNFDSDAESESSLGAESESVPESVPPPTPLSPLALLVNAYNTCPSSSTEKNIVDYLHSKPMTPAGVELLVPAFNRVFTVTNKLATNIGFFYARSQISEDDKEAMLVHLMLKGDWKGVVFDRTNERIARFMGERAQREQRNQQLQRRTNPGTQKGQGKGKMTVKNDKGRQEQQPQAQRSQAQLFQIQRPEAHQLHTHQPQAQQHRPQQSHDKN